MEWFVEHWHTLVTACAALIIGGFILIREVRHYLLPKNERNPADPNTFLIAAISVIVIFLSARVEQVSHRVTEDLDALQQASEKDTVDHFRSLKKRLDSNLVKVHGDDFDQQLNAVLRAVESGEVVVNDIEKVRQLYRQMLPRFSGTEFYSTSIPTRDYFWGDPSILAAMKDFIENRNGAMTRIFFLTTPQPDQEALDIMAEQARAGVTVHYLPIALLPRELNELYFVGANQRIAWRINIDAVKHVSQITTTIRKDDVDRYRRNFRHILALNVTRKFELPLP